MVGDFRETGWVSNWGEKPDAAWLRAEDAAEEAADDSGGHFPAELDDWDSDRRGRPDADALALVVNDLEVVDPFAVGPVLFEVDRRKSAGSSIVAVVHGRYSTARGMRSEAGLSIQALL